MKNKRGITLIALIITIIILLILAGVTINVVVGDNGVLKNAQEAKEKHESASEQEQRGMAASVAAMNFENTEYKGVTIPAGFAPTEIEGENTIEDGLVIIDAKGNEFVYVPIDDVNVMSQCELADGNCHLVLDENQELYCTEHNSTEIVGKLYASSVGENFENANMEYSSNNGLREPDILLGIYVYGEVDALKYSFANYSSYNEMLLGLKNEYKKMAESVAKNGGFYIARYETSLSDDGMASSKFGNTPVTANLMEHSWYDFYTISKGLTNTYITSSMIWGSQYDAVLNWAKKGKDSNKISDVNGIGNNNSGSISKSGDYLNDSINNIKDLGGNLLEWTLEASGQYHRIRRGGNYQEIRSPSYRWTDGVESSSKVLR
ncbi:MAG: hypothetical protein IJ867_06135 [Clostridia bacterium]|nr:hypothetical protein [Clostridia bacterium]